MIDAYACLCCPHSCRKEINVTLHAASRLEPCPDWADVCALDEVLSGTGVAALVNGEQIALIRTRDGALYAISNFDPFSKAFVMARGIVGDRHGVPKIASPIYKQNFNLKTGECLDDPKVRLTVYAVRASEGRIHVQTSHGAWKR
jgi:nitrite reductase (NADH) small subunit